MNNEQDMLMLQGQSVEFPVLFKKESNDAFAVYELRTQVSPDKYLPLKMKVIDEGVLAVKLKSGCYI